MIVRDKMDRTWKVPPFICQKKAQKFMSEWLAKEQTQDHLNMKNKCEPFNSDNGYTVLQNKLINKCKNFCLCRPY